VVSISGAGNTEFSQTYRRKRYQDIDMRIPSIYLPINIELFDDHFQRFFEDFTHIRPGYLNHTLNQIKIGTDRIRYEIEFENLKQSKQVESKRVISQIEVFVVGDNKIEIRAADLDVSSPDNRMGWGEVFLDEFYKMINLKWNVKPFYPNVEDPEDMPMNAARVQLAHDFGISDISYRRAPHSDDNERNDGFKDPTALLPVIDDEEIIKRIEGFNDALNQGLPPIETNNEGLQKSTKRGPVTYSDDEKLNAIRDWDNIDWHRQTLREWLGDRYGSEGGIPNVATSTFQGWRQQLRKKGLLDS
jgi:hypothetical protein